MKISDLSKIDIKTIDVMKIKEYLLDHKDIAIQIGVGVVTFMMVISTLGKSQTEMKGIKSKMSNLQSKSSSIADYNKAFTDTNTFLKQVPPPLSEDQIVSFVTDLADKHNIKIQTVNPLKVEDKDIMTTTTLQFSLTASEYKDMVRLIADIELAKNLLQVKALTAQVQMGANVDTASDVPLIDFRIDVASVKAKL